MCTLTYIPNNNGGFLLTSNRDEKVDRMLATTPAIYMHNGLEVIYPKDTKAGGTWLASSSNKFTLCLLNGAFVKHVSEPPYRKSRGLVVLDFFDYNEINDFVEQYNFENIEPFTLVVIEQKKKIALHLIIWDGEKINHTTPDATMPQIWSSSTLYDPEIIAERKNWFTYFLSHTPQPQLHDMLYFHHFAGQGDNRNNLLMNRENKLKTLSITLVKNDVTVSCMHHEDLITPTTSVSKINLTTANQTTNGSIEY